MRRLELWIATALVAATLAAFWPAQRNEFLAFDDQEYVMQNAVVRRGLTAQGVEWAFTTFHVGNWHPLAWLSHMLDVELYAFDPAGHHRTSMLLHAANGALLFLVLRSASGAVWRSAFAAALFALHPLHVEAVAWVAERKELLATFFGLLAIGAWVRFARAGGVWPYALALACFALGLLAKPMLVTLPFALLLLDVWPLRRLSPDFWRAPELGRLLLEKVPFVALSFASSIVTILAQQSGGGIQSFERYPLVHRLLNVIVVYPLYLAKTVWPVQLSVFYPHPLVWELVQLLVCAIFLGAATWVAWRRRASEPYIAVGWLWYLGTLVPVIGLLQVGTQRMADRYTYLPLVGIFVLVSWGAGDVAARLRLGPRVLAPAAAAVLLALSALTWVQVGTWRTTSTVFEHALRVTPGNWLARAWIGSVHVRRGEPEAAIPHLREVLKVHPDHFGARYELALALEQTGQLDEAFENFGLALRVQPGNPILYLGLGRILRAKGNLAAAAQQFAQATFSESTYEEGYADLKATLMELRARHPEQSFVPSEVSLLRPDDQMEYFMGRSFFDEGLD